MSGGHAGLPYAGPRRVISRSILCGKLAFAIPPSASAMEASVSTKPAPDSSYTILWEGENPAFREALLQELEQSGISYADKPIGEGEVQPDPLPIDGKRRFGFEVAVHQPDLPQAKEILEGLLSEGELADVELPDVEEEVDEGERTSEPRAGKVGEEQATVSVWAGDDSRTMEFLTAALQENEIAIRVVNEGELTVVYVPPSNAGRAREIVREIAEGVPPQ
jgi:hypothetical protein